MKTYYRLALILLLMNGAGAIFGGLSLISDPTGSGLGMNVTLLEQSPFTDFMIPGIVLFIVNGLFSVVVLIWTAFRWKHFTIAIMIEGILLGGWILIQMLMLRHFSVLQLVFGSIGILLCLIGFRMRKHDNG